MNGLLTGQTQTESVSSLPPPLPTHTQFFVAINGQQSGPFDVAELQRMALTGQLTNETLVWKQGMANWTAADQTNELAVIFKNIPPPLPS